jgi:hypothetical protein
VNLLRIGREHINMNKKIILLVLIGVLTILVINLFRSNDNKDSEILALNLPKGVQVTAPIQFTADEKVTAIEFNVVGDIIKVECIDSAFEVIVKTKNGCTLANFNGGSKKGIIGKVTFIQHENTNPLISGILGNSLGNDAKNGVINIEY